MPLVVTNPEAASVLAEPAMTPSVLAEAGESTPSVLAPWGFTDPEEPAGAGAGASAAAVRPVWDAAQTKQQLLEQAVL